MAISFVARGTEVTGSTSVAPGHPAGLAAGDLLLLFANDKRTSAGTQPTVTGFTAISSWYFNSQWSGVWAKTATGSETGTVTVGSLTSSSCGVMLAYRGVSIPSPLTGLVSTAGDLAPGGQPVLHNRTYSTGLVTNQWLVGMYGANDDSLPLTGLTQTVTAGTAGIGTATRRTTDALETATGTDSAAWVFDNVVTTGTSGASTTIQTSFTSNVICQWTYQLLVLSEAAGGTATSNPRPVRHAPFRPAEAVRRSYNWREKASGLLVPDRRLVVA